MPSKKLSVVFLTLAAIIIVSGCTQTGNVVKSEREIISENTDDGFQYQEEAEENGEYIDNDVIEQIDATGNFSVNENLSQANQTKDLCEVISCGSIYEACPDGYVAKCSSRCDGGFCIQCKPDCSDHQNKCENVICKNSEIICPDKTKIACDNICIEGRCTDCEPSCTGHEDKCANIQCQDTEIICPDGFISACSNSCSEGLCSSCQASCTGHEMGHVVFWEVMYDTVGSDTLEEWLSIYNPTMQTINITNWTVWDNTGYWIFPEFEINSQSFVKIARNSEGFRNLYGCDPDIEGFSRGLNNDGDTLTLKNETDTVDFVAWEGGGNSNYTDWSFGAGKGKTIRRNNIDTDSPSDWLESQEPNPC